MVRQFQLIRLLEERAEVGVDEAAERLGATARTVYRDLHVLERMGVPIYQEREGRRARWRIVEGYRRRMTLLLDERELVALAVGNAMAASFGGCVAKGSASCAPKLRSSLPEPFKSRAAKLGALVSSTPEQFCHAGRGDHLDALVKAALASSTVDMTYRKEGALRVSARRLDPYFLHFHDGSMFVIGFCHRRNAVRTFLLDRIESVSPTNSTYEMPKAFSRDDLLQDAFGPWEGRPVCVELAFTRAGTKRLLQRRMHRSQVVQLEHDGSARCILRVPLCPALRRWIESFGSEVRRIRPAALAKSRATGGRVQSARASLEAAHANLP